MHGWYAQDDKPVIDQSEAIGHCVRAMYFYAPLTEIAGLSGQADYKKASERIWKNAVSKKMFLIEITARTAITRILATLTIALITAAGTRRAQPSEINLLEQNLFF